MAVLEEHLPIIEVTNDNFADIWPLLQAAIQDAAFVAIDSVSM